MLCQIHGADIYVIVTPNNPAGGNEAFNLINDVYNKVITHLTWEGHGSLDNGVLEVASGNGLNFGVISTDRQALSWDDMREVLLELLSLARRGTIGTMTFSIQLDGFGEIGQGYIG